MSINKKPVTAATDAQAYENQQNHDTPVLDQFQCPQCKLSGNADLFQPFWPERLHEQIARHPGLGIPPDLANMNYQDARYLYNWLSRHSG
jgi:hypothetical protein